MRALVDSLCGPECEGRAAGTPGGARARSIVMEALRAAGLDPSEQQVPACRGANVLATIPGDTDRWVLLAAHYDHLGRIGRDVYPGADDNAAAVAILVDVAEKLALDRPAGRGVIIAAFDAEEPPHFLTGAMGSEHYARHPIVPLDRTDLMICMDLVGHAVGDPSMPADVRDTVFVLGAERSEQTLPLVTDIARDVPGIVARPMDAETIPPLSDYAAFWQREIPFAFLSNGRSRRYHTPADTPAHLDWSKMTATARWLDRFTRSACALDRITWTSSRNDAITLRSVIDLVTPLLPISPEARAGKTMAESLLRTCDADGRLPDLARPALLSLVDLLESGLA